MCTINHHMSKYTGPQHVRVHIASFHYMCAYTLVHVLMLMRHDVRQMDFAALYMYVHVVDSRGGLDTTKVFNVRVYVRLRPFHISLK